MNISKRRLSLALGFALSTGALALSGTGMAFAANGKNVIASVDAWAPEQAALEHDIWLHPEIAFHEYHTSYLQQKALRAAGFHITTGMGGMPTAYVATYGSGSPVIGIFAEMDALPGLSQKRVAHHDPIPGQNVGHGDGHNLLGMAAVAAGRATAQWLKATGHKGTIKIFGTPAEEVLAGKVYMLKAGAFKGTDAILSWHPLGGVNTASQGHDLAFASGKWTFHGVSAHAGGEPWAGRSALHAAESFTFMVNVMRETTRDFTRLQYIYTKAGRAPNVIPSVAQVYLAIRAPSAKLVRKMRKRVQEAAKGAAMGNQVTVTYEPLGASRAQLDNETLGRVLYASLKEVGGVHLTGETKTYGEAIYKSLAKDNPPPWGLMHKVLPFHVGGNPGGHSSDVGNVSWHIPEAGALCSTWVPGTANHSWQATAQSGGPIGAAGALNCAKVLALSAVKLFESPDTVAKAKQELQERRKKMFDKRIGADWKSDQLNPRTEPALHLEDVDQNIKYKNLHNYEQVIKEARE